MTDRIPHDHPSVDTVRAKLVRAGRTDRPKVVLPEDDGLFPESDDPVQVALDGRRYHARLERDFDGVPELRALRENARLAREGDGPNELVEWFRDSSLDFGRSVHVDVVDPGTQYGIRGPGDRAVYTVTERPDGALADIANDLDD